MGIVEEAHNVGVVGSGQQVLVLAHGIGTDQSIWKYLVPHLVDDNRVIMYDNMGAGTTNPEYFDFERYSTLEGYTYDLLAILEELHVKSCIFVGHSSSAMVGAIAAVTRPDLFTKLIMIAASPRFLNDVERFFSVTVILGGTPRVIQSNYKAWCSGFTSLAVGGDIDSMAVQEFSRILFNKRPDIALSVTQTVLQTNMRQILTLITVPSHILQSVKDLVVSMVVSKYLHQNFDGESIVEIMSSDGHLPQLSSSNIVLGSGGSTILSTYWTLDLGEKEKESMRLSSWELKRLIKEGWEDELIKDHQQSSASMQI
ncbi:hypothetical protein FF1_027426 [Malus domestica]